MVASDMCKCERICGLQRCQLSHFIQTPVVAIDHHEGDSQFEFESI